MSDPTIPAPVSRSVDTLYHNIQHLIETAKNSVVVQVNQALVMTYWQIEKIVKTELLQEGRAPYGAEILKQLAERLRIREEITAQFLCILHLCHAEP